MLFFGYIVFMKDGFYGVFGNVCFVVDVFVGMYVEYFFFFEEIFDGVDYDIIGVVVIIVRFGNNVSYWVILLEWFENFKVFFEL